MDELRELILAQALMFAGKLHRGVTLRDMGHEASTCDLDVVRHGLRTERLVRIMMNSLLAHPLEASVLADECVVHLPFAARFHDVGKIGVPIEVLDKPDRLDDIEYSIMKLHPLMGQVILRATSRHAPNAQAALTVMELVALFHHERWDGAGYPFGSKGDATPLPARIVALADTYDAITSARVYQPRRRHAEAMEVIVAESGKQFDPALVDRFSSLAKALREGE